MNKFAILAATAAVALTTLAAPAMAQQQKPGANDRRPPRVEKTVDRDCGDKFGYFKRVLPEQVAAIDDEYRVWVTPVCMGEDLLRNTGNAAYLRPTIADNEVLVDALFDKSFGPDDVFAVKMMGDDTINLYVHYFAN
jgi:hypothetical protein